MIQPTQDGSNVIGSGFTTWGILREPENLLASTENDS
jgi:hypothetical protein